MGITLETTDYPGCYRARVEGVATYTDHGQLFARVDELIRAGSLDALLVDARRVDLADQPSFARTVWDDAMSILKDTALAFLPPPVWPEERRQLILDVVADWEGCLVELDGDGAADAWCRRNSRTESG